MALDVVGWAGAFAVQMLPCGGVALALWLALLPLRHRSIRSRGLVSGLLREGALLAFWLFAAGLAALTLFPHDFWRSGLLAALRGEPVLPAWSETVEKLALLPWNLIPFHEIGQAGRSGWTAFLLLGNIGMFVPLGLGSAALWRGGSWRRALAVGLGSSCTIELVQFFIGRSTDIDDVILNTAGALLGYGLYLLLCRLAPGRMAQPCCRRPEGVRLG